MLLDNKASTANPSDGDHHSSAPDEQTSINQPSTENQ
jgi:hypothetical protein